MIKINENEHKESNWEGKTGKKKSRGGKKLYFVDFAAIEKHPRNGFEQEVAEKLASEPSPYDILQAEERKEILNQALQKAPLSVNERKVIGLFWEGASLSEIAEELHIKPPTAHIERKRGYEKLKKYLYSKYGEETKDIISF